MTPSFRPQRWLAISVAGNLVCVALLIVAAHRERSRAESLTEIRTAVTPNAGPRSSVAQPPLPAEGAPLEQWVAALRAAGVPEKVVAAAVAADFDGAWWKRQRELQRQFTRGEIDEDALTNFSDQRDAEQEKAMLAALGTEGFQRWHRTKLLDDFDRAGVQLSDAESDAIYQLRIRRDRDVRKLEEARREGLLDESEFTEHTTISQSSYERQLKALLGDERLAPLYPADLETPGVGGLERGLRYANASEAQAVEVHRAQQQADQARAQVEQQHREGKLDAAAYERQVRELAEARDRAVAAALGAEGFEQWQKAQDQRYATMKRFAAAWELTDTEIDTLYRTLKSYDQRARAIRAGGPLGAEKAEMAVRQIEQEADQALRSVLGAERFDRMKKAEALAIQE